MSRIKMPPQIFRLVLLTIAIVVTYLIARYLLTPRTFRQYGFYRGEALVEHMGHTPVFEGRKPVEEGRKTCADCHDVIVKQIAKAEHKTLGCETCHGVARAHVDDDRNVKLVKIGDSMCLRCHENNGSRPAWLKQINPKDHYSGDKCIGCHVPHQPNEVP